MPEGNYYWIGFTFSYGKVKYLKIKAEKKYLLIN